MLLALLLGTALALAYANGANDNFKATATLYGSGAAGYPEARRLATLAQLCGSAASVVLDSPWFRGLLSAFGLLHLLMVVWELLNPTLLTPGSETRPASQDSNHS